MANEEYIWRKSRELYALASEVNQLYCPRELTSTNLRPFSLSGEDQTQNACLLRQKLRQAGGLTTYEGFFKGTATVPRLLDPFKPLTTSLDSAYGVVALAGLQHSPPFMIVKYTIGTDVIPSLYELTLGMIANRLRYEIPNIMYTYAGLYCSPPVNPTQSTKHVLSPIEERGIEQCIEWIESQLQETIPDGPIMSRVRKALEKYMRGKIAWEDTVLKIKRLVLDELALYHPYGTIRGQEISQLAASQSPLVPRLDVSSSYTEEDDINSDVNVSVGDESYISGSHSATFAEEEDMDSFSQDEYRVWKKMMTLLLYRRSFAQEFRELMGRTRRQFRIMAEKASDFNAGLMCREDRPSSVILFAEAVPHPTSLYTFLYQNKQIQENDVIAVWAQLVFALNVAWQRIKFSHNDLHANNVLIRTLSSPIRTEYSVLVNEKTGEIQKVSVESKYVPVLIDLGMARAEYQGKTYGYYWKRIKDVVSKNTKDLLSLNTLFTLVPARIKTHRYRRLQEVVKRTILHKPLRTGKQSLFDQLPAFSGAYYADFIRAWQH